MKPMAGPTSKYTKIVRDGESFYFSNVVGAKDGADKKRTPVPERVYQRFALITHPKWKGLAQLKAEGFGEGAERTGTNLTDLQKTAKRNSFEGREFYAENFAEFKRLIGVVAGQTGTLAGAGRGRGDEPVKGAEVELDEPTRDQGYESDPEIRKLVETYAMSLATAHYEKTSQVTVVGKPYDLDCRSASEHFRVEVKGTRGDGAAVIVTRNEVRHARSGGYRVELFLVSRIEVGVEAGERVAKGGSVSILARWSPEDDDLEPLQYSYRVPRSS